MNSERLKDACVPASGIETPPFQFGLKQVFALTTVVALCLATWLLVRQGLTPAILIGSWVFTGCLLTRLLWLVPHR